MAKKAMIKKIPLESDKEHETGVPRLIRIGKGVIVTGHKSKLSENNSEEGIVRWLGGFVVVKAKVESDYDVISISARGLPKLSIDKLAQFIGVSRKNLAEDVFDVSVKTLERKSSTTRLDKKISSHALEIAKVMQHAFEVFEDEEKSRLWLNRDNRALNGKKPVALFDTLTGLNMVNDILSRIEEGVYS